MNIIFKTIIIVSLCIIFILSVFLINQKTLECRLGGEYDIVSNNCKYEAVNGINDCKKGMLYGDNFCYYSKTGIISKNIFNVIVIIFGIIIIGGIIWVISSRKGKLLELGEIIQKENLDWVTEVKPIFEEYWANEYKITVNDGKVPEGTFVYNTRETFSDKMSGRKFVQFEVECFSAEISNGNGIFTIIMPMDKDKGADTKKHLINNIRNKHARFDNYKIASQRPLGIPRTKDELMRSIIQTSDSTEDLLERIKTQKEIFSVLDPAVEAMKESETPDTKQNFDYSILNDMEPYERMQVERTIPKQPIYRRPIYRRQIKPQYGYRR